MRFFIACIISILFFNYTGTAIPLSSEQGVHYDQVFDSRIRTVQLYREEWNLSYPVITLGSNNKLVLNFDLLGNDPPTLYYTFVHCDTEWRESPVFPNEYLEGLQEDHIEDYHPSFNTRINYYHYRISFPNERIQLKLSGNYIIKVYEPGNNENPVLTKRFMIAEESVAVSASVIRPQISQFYNTGQQLDISVNFNRMNVNDPHRDFSTFILQNGKWINAKKNLKPDFIGSREFRFSTLSTNTVFPGGNEYRYFDIKSIRYQSEYIRKIDFVGSNYHVLLFPSENREFKPYFYWQDFNGKYYVAVQEGKEMDTDADYVNVYFTLPARYRIEDGNVYVYGALNNWALNNDNIMTYDPERAEYQCTMLLKQGWYNYEYIFMRNGEKVPEPSLFEGNHYETENDYLILVYYKNPGDRYERLAGWTVKNSLR